MKIRIEVSESELQDMALAASELQTAVVDHLNGRIDVPAGGRVYLAGFNVEVDATAG